MGIVKTTAPQRWVVDLVRMAALEDKQVIGGELGYPSVANGFRKTIGGSVGSFEAEGYTAVEVSAMHEAIEWLKTESIEHFNVVHEYMRTGKTQSEFRLAAALVLLGQRVDELVG